MTISTRIAHSILLPVLLFGCAAGEPSSKEKTVRVGMHIDANFEFAIEYPLEWTKTRQQNRATGWGVVRWESPLNPEVKLSVSSVLATPEVPDLKARLEQIMNEVPNIKITHREEVKLQGKPALRVIGYTPQRTFELHLQASPRRILTISYLAPPEEFEKNRKVLKEVIKSFIVLEPGNAIP
jgi:hypothetical protein